MFDSRGPMLCVIILIFFVYNAYRLIVKLPFKLHNKFAFLTCNFAPFLHYFSNVVAFLCSRSRVGSAFVFSLRPFTHKWHASFEVRARDRIAYRFLRAGLPTLTPQLQFYWSLLPWHYQPSQPSHIHAV